eukprot:CAMPEP_0178923916 /NCGR_PEP_ID=MMETSP0786-20121207/17030_1 /TAXON_ID=186022 /ORGANISM="Thalassionema frauenfeldii, Strain CCMP 1798" /LENGTH=123 /DNA_ID=CAMNT_0020598555 /DNA_START=74 /DNA_END=445 /DNA_ORIENTATION=-
MSYLLFDDARSIDSDAITVKAGSSPNQRPQRLAPIPMKKKIKSSCQTEVPSSCASSSRSCVSSPPRIRQCLFWKRREQMSRAVRKLYDEEHQVLSNRRKQKKVSLPMKRFLTTYETSKTMAEI